MRVHEYRFEIPYGFKFLCYKGYLKCLCEKVQFIFNNQSTDTTDVLLSLLIGVKLLE